MKKLGKITKRGATPICVIMATLLCYVAITQNCTPTLEGKCGINAGPPTCNSFGLCRNVTRRCYKMTCVDKDNIVCESGGEHECINRPSSTACTVVTYKVVGSPGHPGCYCDEDIEVCTQTVTQGCTHAETTSNDCQSSSGS